MDENLYDEFGNYIGPDLGDSSEEDSEEEEEEEEQEDEDHEGDQVHDGVSLVRRYSCAFRTALHVVLKFCACTAVAALL